MRFESFDAAFHERMRACYLAIARKHPERCIVLDASAGEDALADAVWNTVAKRFKLR
jgi:dTMP kinase